MNATVTIFQCQRCNRQFVAGATGLERAPHAALRVTFIDACDFPDCGTAAQAFADKIAADSRREVQRFSKAMAAHRDRQAAKKLCRSQRARHDFAADDEERVRAGRSSCPEDTEILEPVTLPPAVPLTQSITAKDFTQRDFDASGAGDSSTELLAAWFRQPKNFGQWFTKKFLEDVVMRGKSGCCNNRAKAARERYDWGGNYIDNKMIEVEGCLQSHYALVRIEDAVSLSDEQKKKLMGINDALCRPAVDAGGAQDNQSKSL